MCGEEDGRRECRQKGFDFLEIVHNFLLNKSNGNFVNTKRKAVFLVFLLPLYSITVIKKVYALI